MSEFGNIEWQRYDADDEGCRVTKRNEYKVEDFDDIAWAYLDIPSWWIRKEKEE